MSQTNTVTTKQPAPSPWLERMGDRCNPILVKEVRQALKSRQFVVTFMMLVTAAWLTAVLGVLMRADDVQYKPVGPDFFFYFYIALSLATVLVVPFSAFSSLQNERQLNTFELLSVTTITPKQIVVGKLLSAMVQLLMFYSAITPFMACAAMMQGFDVTQAGYVLVVSALASLMLSMIAVMIGSLSKQKATQVMMSVVLLLGLIMTVYGAIGGVGVVMLRAADRIPVDNHYFWVFNGLALIIASSYFILFRQIATAQLTFETDNRSTAVRMTTSVQLILAWMMWLAIAVFWNLLPPRGLLEAVAGFSTFHLALFGLLMTAEPNALSRRIRRELPSSRLARLFLAPFLPGGARGYLLLIMQTALLWCLFVVVAACFASSVKVPGITMNNIMNYLANQTSSLRIVTALCMYLLIYCGINTALSRWAFSISSEIKPAHVRVVTFLLFMAAVVGPLLLDAIEVIDVRNYNLLQLGNPFRTIDYVQFGRSESERVLIALQLVAGFIVLINVPAMCGSVADVLTSHVKPRSVGKQLPIPDRGT